MKKLNLNRNTFAGGETLTREQLKKIMGGDGYEATGPGGGDETTSDDFSTTDGPGNCVDNCGGALGNCNADSVCRDYYCTDKNGHQVKILTCFHA